MIIPTEVLKVVGIFMKNGANHTLNGGGVIPEYEDGPLLKIIHPIGRSILLPKGPNRIVNLITLTSNVILTPLNGLPNNGPNLRYAHIRGGGL